MYLLIPGRHHLLTQFQFNYLEQIIEGKIDAEIKLEGSKERSPVEGIIFAVTSANHSGTKRNPLAFYLRAMMIQAFSKELEVPVYVYGIDDVGDLEDFASYTCKQIKHQSDLRFDLSPENTAVICSTPVLEMYKNNGFSIFTAELAQEKGYTHKQKLPWEVLEMISKDSDWSKKDEILSLLHPSVIKFWQDYQLDKKVSNILSDPIIGEDGDITASRDYSSYVRQMDEIASIKFQDTSAYIKAGKIGDIGCAVGSWIKQACEQASLRESDFYGIEIARQLFDICIQRKHNGEFANPNVFFSQKNAVNAAVFEKNSMDTIHTSSLTHEIESYGSRKDLLQFIQNRYDELKPGGLWINRDVIGPLGKEQQVYMELTKEDGSNEAHSQQFSDSKELAHYLAQLSTFTRFKRFGEDFRIKEQDKIRYEIVHKEGKELISLNLADAAEFMLTKDYTDNWESEMHERFCFWSLADWTEALSKVGFEVLADSYAYTNPWIAENRFHEKVKLYDQLMNPLAYPPTNAIIIARKV